MKEISLLFLERWPYIAQFPVVALRNMEASAEQST